MQDRWQNLRSMHAMYSERLQDIPSIRHIKFRRRSGEHFSIRAAAEVEKKAQPNLLINLECSILQVIQEIPTYEASWCGEGARTLHPFICCHEQLNNEREEGETAFCSLVRHKGRKKNNQWQSKRWHRDFCEFWTMKGDNTDTVRAAWTAPLLREMPN